MTTPTSPTAAPGWYSDPYTTGSLRYFDGHGWTPHVAPAPAAAAPAAAAPLAFSPAFQFEQYVAPGSRPSDPLHWLVPTGRTWQSIAAGYIGLCALFLWVLGPVAVGFGVWALKASKTSGSHGRVRALFGIVSGIVATVILVAVLV